MVAAQEQTRAGPVLLLDAFSLFFRAFYALPGMNTTRGEPTSAVYGLSVLLLKLLREQRPRGLAFAMDVGPTFRHVDYQPYKATRNAAPSSLGAQMPRLTQLLRVLDVPALGSPGFEADDVLATLCRELTARGEAPMVVTGDHDCLQLARGAARVMIVSRGAVKAEIYDELAIRMRFGLRPDQLPEYRALVGDPSDNIPGVPGIGPRTGSALIGRFGDVATLLARLEEVTPPRTREAIRAVQGKLPLYADISRLRDQVPLPADPHWKALGADARDRLRAFFEELEFKSLLPRIDAAFGVGPP